MRTNAIGEPWRTKSRASSAAGSAMARERSAVHRRSTGTRRRLGSAAPLHGLLLLHSDCALRLHA